MRKRELARQVLAGLDSDKRREAYVAEHGRENWERLVATAELSEEEKYRSIAAPEIPDPGAWTQAEKIRFIKRYGVDSFAELTEKSRVSR